MRDQTTAEIGMRAAITGHMVLSTLHTNDVISTPIRLLDMGCATWRSPLHPLQLVLAQRLVRVVCENCAGPHTPAPHEHEWLRYELGDTVDQRKPCMAKAARIVAALAITGEPAFENA